MFFCSFLQFLSVSNTLLIGFICLDGWIKDCIDARMSAWALGGGSDASSLQMQCMAFCNIAFLSITYLL